MNTLCKLPLVSIFVHYDKKAEKLVPSLLSTCAVDGWRLRWGLTYTYNLLFWRNVKYMCKLHLFIPCQGKIPGLHWFQSVVYNVVDHAKNLYTTLPWKQCHKCNKNITVFFFRNITIFYQLSKVLLWWYLLVNLHRFYTIGKRRKFSSWCVSCTPLTIIV